MYLSGAVLKILVLQIIIKASLAEFIFSKIPCFQHIFLLNTFRRMCLNYENCSLRRILFYNLVPRAQSLSSSSYRGDEVAYFRLQKPHCENIWWKHITHISCKNHFGKKEQKAMFLVVSRLDVHFGFECPVGGTSKIARPKNRAPRKKFVYPCVVSFEGLMT